MANVELWRELGKQLRVDSVRSSDKAGSGHPTSSMSAADLMSVLISSYLQYDFKNPDNPNNDHLVFSKGHASPLLYAMFKAAQAISDEEMLNFRKFGSRLQGHPTPEIDWVDVATGSLGQGLPIAVGTALAGKYLDRLPYRIWVLCGDSEMAEGSMWEAFEYASAANLDNLTAIIDVNRLGQRGETRHGWNLKKYSERCKAFGWHTIEIDGHDFSQIDAAFEEALRTTGQPSVIIAKTVKGSGIKSIEDKDGFHGKALDNADAAIKELGGIRNIKINVKPPPKNNIPHVFDTKPSGLPQYDVGDKIPTRRAYGDALVSLGTARSDVVALDGEVSNSTYAEDFAGAHPDRFFETYIAEQQLVAAAIGVQVRNWKPFASTFAAFFARAYDFTRMAAVSQANIKLVGSHAGVSIGPDGPSQMGLEDIASLRAVHNSTVLYPSDANQTTALMSQMVDREGIVYLRTTREATPVLYNPGDCFPIGGSKIVKSSGSDDVTLVGAGITLHEAIRAAETLEAEGISARVIDLYSIKPIDAKTLQAAARDTGCIVTVEDHWPEGGLGEAVLSVFTDNKPGPMIRILAVQNMPTSGSPAELMSAAEIDAQCISTAARDLVSLKD